MTCTIRFTRHCETCGATGDTVRSRSVSTCCHAPVVDPLLRRCDTDHHVTCPVCGLSGRYVSGLGETWCCGSREWTTAPAESAAAHRSLMSRDV